MTKLPGRADSATSGASTVSRCTLGTIMRRSTIVTTFASSPAVRCAVTTRASGAGSPAAPAHPRAELACREPRRRDRSSPGAAANGAGAPSHVSSRHQIGGAARAVGIEATASTRSRRPGRPSDAARLDPEASEIGGMQRETLLEVQLAEALDHVGEVEAAVAKRGVLRRRGRSGPGRPARRRLRPPGHRSLMPRSRRRRDQAQRGARPRRFPGGATSSGLMGRGRRSASAAKPGTSSRWWSSSWAPLA